MVEWNKNFACRIASLPGLKVPAFESNGPQNYRNWNEMEKLTRAAASLSQKSGTAVLSSIRVLR